MRVILFLLGTILLLLSFPAAAQPTSCGIVDIDKVLTGPRHGAMIRVVNPSCTIGNDNWICIDPDAQHMSEAESSRLFSFLLAYHLADKQIALMIDSSKHTSACGGTYALLHDARSP